MSPDGLVGLRDGDTRNDQSESTHQIGPIFGTYIINPERTAPLWPCDGDLHRSAGHRQYATVPGEILGYHPCLAGIEPVASRHVKRLEADNLYAQKVELALMDIDTEDLGSENATVEVIVD